MELTLSCVFLLCLITTIQCAVKYRDGHFVQNASHEEFIPYYHDEFQYLANYIQNTIRNLNDGVCKNQLNLLADGLANSSLWAVQMVDASAKLPIGLIVANTYQLGHYDECVAVTTHKLKGKYCIADIKFAPKQVKYPDYYNGHVENEFSLHYDPYNSVWEKFKITADPSKKRRDIFHSAICIPDGCSAEEGSLLVHKIANDIGSKLGYHVQVTVQPSSCSTAESKPFSLGSSVIIYLIIFLFLSVVICTAWDVSRDRKKPLTNSFNQIMESFSMHHNMAKLSQPDATHEMNVFHGMKFYSIALIMLGHRCVHSYGAPFFNPEFLEERYRKIGDMFLLNGSLIVDTFFVVGGYLTCYALIKEAQAGRKIKAFQVYLYRWLRITPMYMLVVFFYAYLLEHLGSGPIWGLKVGREANRCRENWWSNLFYINNYVNNEEMCMFQSWYVSCDMHFTLLAPFIVTALVKKPSKGLAYLSSIILMATLIPFGYTFYHQHDGVLRVYMQIFENLPKNLTFSAMYIKSHHRAVPYFIGMAGAYVFTILQKNNFKFSKWMVWTGSLISTALSIWAIWGAWYFYIPGRKYNALENATYAAVHRIAWAVAMTWIPVAGGRRAFGIIQPILSKQALAPLSRLSFGAFLVHGAVQLYLTASMRVPEYIFFPKLFWMAAGDLLFSFLFSFLLHIIFEAPIQGLLKHLLLPKRTRISSDKESKEK